MQSSVEQWQEDDHKRAEKSFVTSLRYWNHNVLYDSDSDCSFGQPVFAAESNAVKKVWFVGVKRTETETLPWSEVMWTCFARLRLGFGAFWGPW